MGKLEKEAKKTRVKQNVQKIILGTIAATGLLSISILAPNALQALKIFDAGKRRAKNPKYVVGTAVSRLLDQGLIWLDNTPKGKFIRLTQKGEEKLRLYERHDFNLKKPKKWDKKWRIIIFDIKVARNSLRNKLRNTLKAIGFYRLQHSVWVYPYDCENLLIMLKADFKIGKDILYIIADKIENDRYLKSVFSL